MEHCYFIEPKWMDGRVYINFALVYEAYCLMDRQAPGCGTIYRQVHKDDKGVKN